MRDEPLNPTKKALWDLAQEAMAKANSGTNVPSAGVGALLVGAPAGAWVSPVASIGDSGPGAKGSLVWDPVGGIWSATIRAVWAAQATWFVDSVAGDDDNTGLTAPAAIKTLAELERRLYRTTISQNTVVVLTGSFANQDLTLDLVVVSGFTLSIQGTATTVYSGTVTGKTDAVAGTAVPTFTDAAMPDFAAYLNMRARLIAGASVGAWTWIMKALLPTQAQASQWNIDGTKKNGTLNTYVIETLVPVGSITSINNGEGTVKMSNLAIDGTIYGISETTDLLINGCSLNDTDPSAFSVNIAGPVYYELNGCLLLASLSQSLPGSFAFLSAIATAPGKGVTVNGLLSLIWCVLQGPLSVQGSAYVGVFSDLAFVNVTTNPAVLVYGTFNPNGPVWGTTTGSDGMQVVSTGRLNYVTTKPTVTGATVALRLGGNQLPWTSVPVSLSGATAEKQNTRLPDALEVNFNFGPAETAKAVAFPAGVILNGAVYAVEFVELAPAGGTPAPSTGPWPTVLATTGFTANISVVPGAGVTRNFTARIKL